jgi:hypothetical protein
VQVVFFPVLVVSVLPVTDALRMLTDLISVDSVPVAAPAGVPTAHGLTAVSLIWNRAELQETTTENSLHTLWRQTGLLLLVINTQVMPATVGRETHGQVAHPF